MDLPRLKSDQPETYCSPGSPFEIDNAVTGPCNLAWSCLPESVACLSHQWQTARAGTICPVLIWPPEKLLTRVTPKRALHRRMG